MFDDRTVERSIRGTMESLNLTRVNHAVLIGIDTYAGMLQKVKDFVTWGEISAEHRWTHSRPWSLVGDHPITDAVVKDGSNYKDIDSFAKAIASGEATVKDLEAMKRVFRLHPPRETKGWGGVKRPLQWVAHSASEAMHRRTRSPNDVR